MPNPPKKKTCIRRCTEVVLSQTRRHGCNILSLHHEKTSHTQKKNKTKDPHPGTAGKSYRLVDPCTVVVFRAELWTKSHVLSLYNESKSHKAIPKQREKHFYPTTRSKIPHVITSPYIPRVFSSQYRGTQAQHFIGGTAKKKVAHRARRIIPAPRTASLTRHRCTGDKGPTSMKGTIADKFHVIIAVGTAIVLIPVPWPQVSHVIDV